MQCGGPYWLPPRRAPFGRRAGQPSEGAPTGTARSPRAGKRDVPICPLLGGECTTPRPRQEPEHRVLRSFPPSGTCAIARQRGTKLRIVAAEACRTVFRANGDRPRRVVRLSTADSLCDRMERGEEEAPDRRRGASPSPNSADVKAVRFRRATAENFRPEIFEARATLREQRESAVGRRITKPHLSPFARKTAPHASATATLQVRPRLLANEECPHFQLDGVFRRGRQP